ncbi:type II secretion system F family protein [Aneurinibacillus sp. BA2021]|nr:type II secretion system F family protein [Aneurinibacillus sp. BA2021]
MHLIIPVFFLVLGFFAYEYVPPESPAFAIIIAIYIFFFVYEFIGMMKNIFQPKGAEEQFLSNYLRDLRGDEQISQGGEQGQALFQTGDKVGGIMPRKTYHLFMIAVGVGSFFFGFLLFQNVFLALCFAVFFALYYPKYYISTKVKKRQETFNLQFKEALYSISNSLKSGLSFVSALERALEDMKRLYGKQKEKPIIQELEIIVYDIKMGASLEEALHRFKLRMKGEDVQDFVNASLHAKTSGGNLAEVMASVAKIIGDKITIQNEILVATASKRSEASILSVTPFVILLVLMFLSPEYMKPMYDTALGQGMLVLGVLFLVMNFIISKKIMDIKI